MKLDVKTKMIMGSYILVRRLVNDIIHSIIKQFYT